MNKRIRELAEQAMESTGVEGLGGEYRELNPEKFAELIAAAEREACADFLEHGVFDDDGHHKQYAKVIRARSDA